MADLAKSARVSRAGLAGAPSLQVNGVDFPYSIGTDVDVQVVRGNLSVVRVSILVDGPVVVANRERIISAGEMSQLLGLPSA